MKYLVSAILFCSFAGILLFLTEQYRSGIVRGPDEWVHLDVVRHYAENNRLATWKDFRYDSQRAHSYHVFSPLGYWPYTPFFKHKNPRETARGGYMFVIAQFTFTFMLCSRLIPNGLIALITALSINLWPQLRYLHGYVNADSFGILCATIASYNLVRLYQLPAVTYRESFLCGLTLGLLALSKLNAVTIGMPLALMFLWKIYKTENTALAEKTRNALLAGGCFLLMTNWFVLFLYQELGNGSIDGTTEHLAFMRNTFSHGSWLDSIQPKEVDYGIVIPSLVMRRINDFWGIWETFCGSIWRHSAVNEAYKFVMAALFLMGFLGLFIRRTQEASPGDGAPPLVRPVLVIGPLVFLLTYILLGAQAGLSIQGRLLIPTLPLTLLSVLIGLSHLAERLGVRQEPALASASTLLGLLCVYGNIHCIYLESTMNV